MPHASANPLDVLSTETFLSPAAGLGSVEYVVPAAGTHVFQGTMRPGIYGIAFREDADDGESFVGKFVVTKAADGVADLISVLGTAVFGPGLGLAIFDVGGAAAAATEINLSISSTGIMTAITGASIAAGRLNIWKEINFPT